MSVLRKLRHPRNRQMIYFATLSFLASIIGYMIVQVFGATVTSFSVWTLQQSLMRPPQFPFIYVPEIVVYGGGIFFGIMFYVMLLFRLRMIR